LPYEKRFYREWQETPDLVSFDVCVRQTDLRVRAQRNLRSKTLNLVHAYRRDIEGYAAQHPEFLSSLAPLPVPLGAPPIVTDMLRAGRAYDVGPMAAVAGAIAEYVGRDLLALSPQCIIENGGDIFLKLDRPARLGLYAGPDSPFTRKLVILVDSSRHPMGVCASSGTVGHSLSFGMADAVVAVASSATLADAAATSVGNRVKCPEDVERVVEDERRRGTLDALVVVIGKRFGAFGAIELASADRAGPAEGSRA
jgi:ApbE superfamily uncharacterized protein (UPF0280 family)